MISVTKLFFIVGLNIVLTFSCSYWWDMAWFMFLFWLYRRTSPWSFELSRVHVDDVTERLISIGEKITTNHSMRFQPFNWKSLSFVNVISNKQIIQLGMISSIRNRIVKSKVKSIRMVWIRAIKNCRMNVLKSVGEFQKNLKKRTRLIKKILTKSLEYY